jgi:pSer/pThr/pTyr-binding forkhead associated (FHA) protein
MTCTVCLHDQYMSASHAEIKAEGGVWVLYDLGSTNGTFVNGSRVKGARALRAGDVVRIGETELRLQ